MRSYRQQQRTAGMFRGAEPMRLLTGILMLAVLCMLIVRAADPNTWRWLADDGRPKKQSQPPAQRPITPAPQATGPTDEDSDQAAAAREEFQALTDGTLGLGPEEMVPYNRVVQWVKNQSFARLAQRAKAGLWYTDLYDAPNKNRGKLVSLNLEVRRAKDVGTNQDGVELWEAWAVTDESRGRLYDVIVVDYPQGMPVGYNINEKAKFVGYFLKLQGYVPAAARPGAASEKAPLLIGRLQWKPTVAPQADDSREWIWATALLAIIGLALALRFFYYKRKPVSATTLPGMRSSSSGEAVHPVDLWLEQAGRSENDEEGHREEK